MRFQTLLLPIVILFSLFLSGAVLPARFNQNRTIDSNYTESSFSKDFYSASLKKMDLANQNLTVGFSIIGENLATEFFSASQNIEQNLMAIKQIFLENRKDFFLKINPKRNSEKVDNIIPALFVSRADYQDQKTPCDFNKSIFSAKAVLIKILNNNSNLFELNSEKRWPIASLTKLMTSVIAIEKIGLEKEIIMSEKAVSTEGVAGDFRVGEAYKISDLIKAMLISSSNDAAMAVIENFGEKEFIDEMQKKAKELKMFQTSYLEPTGLSFINQSTADDLVKLINYIYQNHFELLEISRQKKVEVKELKSKIIKEILNVNKFAGQPDFIGGKTGYIEEAGKNLIAIFEFDGKKILSIVLGADDSFEETKKIKNLIKNCK